MKPPLKTFTRSCLLLTALILFGVASAWCATPEIEAAKQNVKQAEARFASLTRLPAFHRMETLLRNAENTASDKATDQAEEAACDAGGVGNKEEEEKAYREKYNAVYQQVHDTVYKDELAKIMRAPKNAVLYRDATAPLKVVISRLQQVVPVLEQDATFEKHGLPKRHWKQGLDHAEKSLADPALLEKTLALVEQIMNDMKAALEIAEDESE